MKKACFWFFLGALIGYPLNIFAETEESPPREPDSVYVEQEERAEDSGGGLLDFLPFFGEGKQPQASDEALEPSPPPRDKTNVPEEDLSELKMVTGHWLLTSEITEPSVRKTEDGRYYRDYIVFDDEYKIEVVRGDSPEKPYIARVYVRGDYFHTAPHESAERAQSDYDFQYEPLNFRVLFERIEKWDYSAGSEENPIVFREQWVFRKLQSQAKTDISQTPSVAPAPAETTRSAEELMPDEIVAPPQ